MENTNEASNSKIQEISNCLNELLKEYEQKEKEHFNPNYQKNTEEREDERN